MNSRNWASVPPRQEGGIGKVFLWFFAAIGLVTTVLLTVIAYWEMSAEDIQPPQAQHEQSADLVAGSKVVTLNAGQQAQFDRSCNICHGQVGTGAPLTKDIIAWQPRVEQGSKILLQHTVEGHLGMPPMGMCMECTDKEFKAFIEYMAQVELAEECE